MKKHNANNRDHFKLSMTTTSSMLVFSVCFIVKPFQQKIQILTSLCCDQEEKKVIIAVWAKMIISILHIILKYMHSVVAVFQM